MARKKSNTGRWRCLTTGCNPVLDAVSATTHNAETGHRVATWPVRSREGERRARERNRTGYYDRYNVGAKDAQVRFGRVYMPSEEPTFWGGDE